MLYFFIIFKSLYFLVGFKFGQSAPIQQEMTDKGKCVTDEWISGITFTRMN